jgi:hypothetical protein
MLSIFLVAMLGAWIGARTSGEATRAANARAVGVLAGIAMTAAQATGLLVSKPPV